MMNTVIQDIVSFGGQYIDNTNTLQEIAYNTILILSDYRLCWLANDEYLNVPELDLVYNHIVDNYKLLVCKDGSGNARLICKPGNAREIMKKHNETVDTWLARILYFLHTGGRYNGELYHVVNVFYRINHMCIIGYNIPVDEVDSDKVEQIRRQYQEFAKVFDGTDLNTEIEMLRYGPDLPASFVTLDTLLDNI